MSPAAVTPTSHLWRGVAASEVAFSVHSQGGHIGAQVSGPVPGQDGVQWRGLSTGAAAQPGWGRVAGVSKPLHHVGQAGQDAGPSSTQGVILTSVMSSAVGWGGRTHLGGCPGSKPAQGKAENIIKKLLHSLRMAVCVWQGCSWNRAMESGRRAESNMWS